MIESLLQWLADALGVDLDSVKKVGITIALIAGYGIARRFTGRLIGSSVEDASSRYRFVKASQLLLLAVSIVLLARIWFQGATGVGTWLGLVSAGIAVSLQDPLENLAGWIYIATSRPFKVGDRIQIGEHAGDVVDIHPFSFTLLEIGNWVNADQSTGRLIHVPNGWLFKHAVAGYDHGFPYIWNEISVTVTFESDWKKAKSLLQEILDSHAQKIEKEEFDRASEAMHIQYTRVTPVVWTDTAPEGVRLTMRYLCAPRHRRVSTSNMWEAILDSFNGSGDIDFAYPTTRRFDHAFEGKPAMRPEEAPNRSDRRKISTS
ncbi:MAG: mechanosensitive ion channel [Polyangiaceae bacterium]|nr:mechanosensitive ion channel [Polyangiaceae bacterium]